MSTRPAYVPHEGCIGGILIPRESHPRGGEISTSLVCAACGAHIEGSPAQVRKARAYEAACARERAAAERDEQLAQRDRGRGVERPSAAPPSPSPKKKRLKQLPLVLVDDDVRRAVDAPPPRLEAIAHHLRQRAVDDDRTWLEVTLAAAAAEGATLAEVLEGDRHRGPAAARRRAWWEIREHTTASYPVIGEAFGGVHHTTIMAAVEKRAAELAAERKVHNEVERFQSAAGAACDIGAPAGDVDQGAAGEEYSAREGAPAEQVPLDWDREHPQLPIATLAPDRATEDAEIADAQEKLLRRRAQDGLPSANVAAPQGERAA